MIFLSRTLIMSAIRITPNFMNAVSDVINNIDACNALLFQIINSLAFLLAKNCDQYICASNFLFAGRLNVKNRALQYALETECWLGFAFQIIFRNEWRS